MTFDILGDANRSTLAWRLHMPRMKRWMGLPKPESQKRCGVVATIVINVGT